MRRKPHGKDPTQQRQAGELAARAEARSTEKLGRHRWVVERTLAWLARKRRLMIRYERLAAMHRAFLHLGCVLICLNYLKRL